MLRSPSSQTAETMGAFKTSAPLAAHNARSSKDTLRHESDAADGKKSRIHPISSGSWSSLAVSSFKISNILSKPGESKPLPSILLKPGESKPLPSILLTPGESKPLPPINSKPGESNPVLPDTCSTAT
jgi:hypothetical protein